MKDFSKFGTLLTKEEAKKITGRGGGSGDFCLPGILDCNPGLVCMKETNICVGEGSGGTCAMIAWGGDSWHSVCNESKEVVLYWFSHYNTSQKWWCCDSCSSTSWYNSECG